MQGSRAASSRSPLITVMAKAAEKAARSLRRDFGEVENLEIKRKSDGDFVSRADTRAEKIIQDELLYARPEFGFRGEESGKSVAGDGIHEWIVDPLDGTTNFLHGIPHFCTSIGLVKNNEIIAGLIYDVIADEMFWAEKGEGAFANGKRLRMSKRTDLVDALTITNAPTPGVDDHKSQINIYAKLIGQTCGVRDSGSAALGLAWTAAGRVDGFWTGPGILSAWDVTAGILMVREASGVVTDYKDKTATHESESFVAANIDLHPKLMKIIKSTE